MYDNCGALQDTIQILRAQPGQDAQGNAITTWMLIAETKAQARATCPAGSSLRTRIIRRKM